MCSPKNIDLCDDAKKAEISKFQSMDAAELDKLIETEEKKLEAAEEEFKEEVQKLQDKYTSLNTEKDEKIKAVKDAGLGECCLGCHYCGMVVTSRNIASSLYSKNHRFNEGRQGLCWLIRQG